MPQRVIPIPDKARPEVRLLLQKTHWNNAKIAQYASLLSVGIADRIREATDRMWSYLASELPEVRETDDKMMLDRDRMRVMPLDEQGKPIEERAILIEGKYAPVLDRLMRDIEVAQESRSCVPYTIMKIDAEIDLVYQEVMTLLRRHIPQINQGGVWAVDQKNMTVYETDVEEIQKQALPADQ